MNRLIAAVMRMLFPEQHVFTRAISIRMDDGKLGVLRCMKCGYCTYADIPSRDDPPCVPRAHEWKPIKVFQWENLPLSGQLPQPLQCTLCGAHALTHREWERLGCPGCKKEDPSDAAPELHHFDQC